MLIKDWASLYLSSHLSRSVPTAHQHADRARLHVFVVFLRYGVFVHFRYGDAVPLGRIVMELKADATPRTGELHQPPSLLLISRPDSLRVIAVSGCYTHPDSFSSTLWYPFFAGCCLDISTLEGQDGIVGGGRIHRINPLSCR